MLRKIQEELSNRGELRIKECECKIEWLHWNKRDLNYPINITESKFLVDTTTILEWHMVCSSWKLHASLCALLFVSQQLFFFMPCPAALIIVVINTAHFALSRNRLLLRWKLETTPRKIPRQNFHYFCIFLVNNVRAIEKFCIFHARTGTWHHTSCRRSLIYHWAIHTVSDQTQYVIWSYSIYSCHEKESIASNLTTHRYK